MIRLLIRSVAFLVLSVGLTQAAGPFLPDHLWPLSGSSSPYAPLASTFGPRQLASENFRYDFHRGLDIPAPLGTFVYAVADGEVRLAGEYSYYSDPLVQLRHTKPDGSGYYYTNYMHLSGWFVAEGDVVQKGDIIGVTGASASGFEHLHFEVRDGGIYQRNCVHPYLVLPYGDLTVPEVSIVSVDLLDPGAPIVQVAVTLPRDYADDDLDFNRVEVSVYEKVGKKLVLVDQHAYDMNEWNAAYTPPSPEDPNIHMDDPDFNGVSVSPVRFNGSSTLYEVGFTFYDLVGPGNADKTVIKAIAADVRGNSSSAQYPAKGGGGGKGGGGKGGPKK